MSENIPNELSHEVPFIDEPMAAYSSFKRLVESSAAISLTTIGALATRSASGPHDTTFESEELTLEALVGRPNFIPSWFLSVGAERSKSVGLMKCSGVDYKGRVGVWSGTGTLISPNIVLTNHHVLNSIDVARSSTMVLGYEFNEDSDLQVGVSCNLNPDRLFITSPVQDGLDFTLCWIDDAPTEFGYCQVKRHMFSVQESDPANIIQHPDQRPKEVVIQENKITSLSENASTMRRTPSLVPREL